MSLWSPVDTKRAAGAFSCTSARVWGVSLERSFRLRNASLWLPQKHWEATLLDPAFAISTLLFEGPGHPLQSTSSIIWHGWCQSHAVQFHMSHMSNSWAWSRQRTRRGTLLSAEARSTCPGAQVVQLGWFAATVRTDPPLRNPYRCSQAQQNSFSASVKTAWSSPWCFQPGRWPGWWRLTLLTHHQSAPKQGQHHLDRPEPLQLFPKSCTGPEDVQSAQSESSWSAWKSWDVARKVARVSSRSPRTAGSSPANSEATAMAILGANLSGAMLKASTLRGFDASRTESLGHWHTMSDQLTHKTNVSKHLGFVPDLVGANDGFV